VHYWADLQFADLQFALFADLHGFRCYDNIAPNGTQNIREYSLYARFDVSYSVLSVPLFTVCPLVLQISKPASDTVQAAYRLIKVEGLKYDSKSTW